MSSICGKISENLCFIVENTFLSAFCTKNNFKGVSSSLSCIFSIVLNFFDKLFAFRKLKRKPCPALTEFEWSAKFNFLIPL